MNNSYYKICFQQFLLKLFFSNIVEQYELFIPLYKNRYKGNKYQESNFLWKLNEYKLNEITSNEMKVKTIVLLLVSHL